MTTFQKWLLGISIVALALLIIFWKQIKKFFTTPANIPVSDYEKCVKANQSKPDGEACSNCVSEGSGQPSFNGIIKNGVCTVIPQPASIPIAARLKVVNPAGASVYVISNNNFVSPANPRVIAVNTVLNLNQLIQRGNYIQIGNNEWLLNSDVQSVTI